MTVDASSVIARINAELASRELQRRNLLPFIQRFHPSYQVGWVHRSLTSLLDTFMQMVADKQSPRLIINVCPRVGKALAIGEKIPTVRGMENIESLRVGDTVIGADGWPTAIVATARWKNRPRYRVTTDDGASVIVDANHEWEARICRRGPGAVFKTYTTEYLANHTPDGRKPAIRCVAVEERIFRFLFHHTPSACGSATARAPMRL